MGNFTMKKFLALLLTLATLAFVGALSIADLSPAEAQVPCQWNYTLINGVATATYCGVVNSNGGTNVIAVSIAAMEAIQNPLANTGVIVTGTQGGTFIYSTSACDNSGLGDSGTQFPSNYSGCWIRQYSGPLHSEWFSGSDIGAQVNAAFASFSYLIPNSCGEVDLPSGNYTISTRIVFPTNAAQSECYLKGQGRNTNGGTRLSYTGSGIAINATTSGQSGSPPYLAGKLADFTLVGANSAANCGNGIQSGNINGLIIRDVEVSNFIGTSCPGNSFGLNLINNVTNSQTEGFDVSIAVTNDATGVQLQKGTGTNSFEHGKINIYYTGGGAPLALVGGAYLARGELSINGDLINGASEIYIDSSSGLQNEHVLEMAEVISGSATLINVQSGGLCNSISGFFWTQGGAITNSGCSIAGDIDGTGDWEASNYIVGSGALQSGYSFTVTGGGGNATIGNTTAVEEVKVTCTSGGNGFEEIVPFVNNTSVGTAFGVLNYGSTPTRTYTAGANLLLSVNGSATWSCSSIPFR
jgi:hypothetical protein